MGFGTSSNTKHGLGSWESSVGLHVGPQCVIALEYKSNLIIALMACWARRPIGMHAALTRLGCYNVDTVSPRSLLKEGKVSSSSMEHFTSRHTTTNLWFFSTSGNGNALNYINLMHQIRRIITVAQLHVCRRVLLDVRVIVRVFKVFVQLLRLKLVF